MKLSLAVLCLFILIFIASAHPKKKFKKPKHRGQKPKRRSGILLKDANTYETFVHHAEFVVGMVRRFEQYHQYLCAGILVSKNWVFTSNTCGLIPTELEQLLGLVVIRGGTKWIEGLGGYDHRILTIAFWRDIAFIKVKDQFINEPYELPIPLIASELYQYNVSEVVSSFGWGESIAQGSTSGTLKTVQLKLITNDDCHQYYPFVYETRKEYVCAQSERGVVCSGDGGGPLIHENILIGIALKDNECDIRKPSVYLRLSNYMWEILTELREEGYLLKYYPQP